VITAYGDESGSDHRLDPHSYIFAVAYVAAEDNDQVRNAMNGLREPGQRKLHWRDESVKRRRLITERIATMKVELLVVVRTGVAGERPERRRKECVARIIYELTNGGIEHAVFESRGRADDKRDRDLLDSLRANRSLTNRLRLDHEKGPREPLLWIADAACGAVAAERAGNPEYANKLRCVMTVIDISR